MGWVKTSPLERFTVKRNILERVDKQRFDLFGLKPLHVLVSKPLTLLKIPAVAIHMRMLKVVILYEQERSQILVKNASSSHASRKILLHGT